jgi:uncharacterized protein
MSRYLIAVIATLAFQTVFSQSTEHHFRIRTITAGITVSSLSDTSTVIKAFEFLKQARRTFQEAGYEVQTIRIATQNLYEYINGKTYSEALPYLTKFDRIAQKDDIAFALGAILPPDQYDPNIASWAAKLIMRTKNISISLPISSPTLGVHSNSIKAAAEIIIALSKNTQGGEGNFRFTASANCPSGIPFFPAAFHEGPDSFAIGLESPNIFGEVFSRSGWNNARQNLKAELENSFVPVQGLAMQISKSAGWPYDGIDTSPAPGLDASIGQAIETLTRQPFGGPSTLSACALITDVIKSLDLKTCGYSGLMLPVIEDKVLAKRAAENRFTVQELLLFSSVSGTGLDVVPLPGNTTQDVIARILHDVASLSLKYTKKALSARLFLIPGKDSGDIIEFDNPYLTPATVMKIE